MDRFWSKVAKVGPDECWLWMGGRVKAPGRLPYGHWAWWESGKCRSTGAHREAWRRTHGPIPDGMMVLHRCDNPPCCNPAHLWLGTHADNMADKVAKGRQWRGGRPVLATCKRGHPSTPENTMYAGQKRKRRCLQCHRERSLASYHKRKAETL